MTTLPKEAISDAIAAFGAGQHPSGATLEQRMEAAILADLPHLGRPAGYLFEVPYSGDRWSGQMYSEVVPTDARNVRPLYLAPPAPAVAIKPLEWLEGWCGSDDDYPCWRAKTPFGPGISVSFTGAKKHSDVDPDELKSALACRQADYEARIRSALVDAPAAAPEPPAVSVPETPDSSPAADPLMEQMAEALVECHALLKSFSEVAHVVAVRVGLISDMAAALDAYKARKGATS